jgi:hypothetical protein
MAFKGLKMKILLMVSVLAFVIISITSASGDIIQSFADFDGAYIPAIALTNQNNIELSKKSVEILKNEWLIFKKDFYSYNTEDSYWKKDFDKVESIIFEAESTINSTGNLKTFMKSLKK